MTNSTSLLWDNNPRLIEITRAILDPTGKWLANATEKELEILYPLIWNEEPTEAQIRLIAARDINPDDSDETPINRFRQQIDNWLNQHEEDFIKESWLLRIGRIKQLTDERNRAIANEWAAKAVTSANRKTAFRLAELAHAIDPAGNENLTVKEKLLQYYYFSTEPPFYSLDEHGANVSDMAFSDDGSILATSGADNIIRLWDTATGASLAHLTGHNGHVSAIQFLPGSSTGIISASHDRTVKAWQQSTSGSWSDTLTLTNHNNPVEAVAISPNGRYLAAGYNDGQLILWIKREDNYELKSRVNTGTHKITTLGFSPNSQKVVMGNRNGKVSIWTIANDELTTEAEFEGHGNMLIYTTYFLDDEYVVSGELDRRLLCWNINGKGEPQVLASENERNDFHVRHAAVSSNQRYLVLSADRIFLYAFDRKNKSRGYLLHSLNLDAGALHSKRFDKLTFSNDGKRLAGIIGPSVKVWNLAFSNNRDQSEGFLEYPYDYYLEHGQEFLTVGGERNLDFSPDHAYRLEADDDSAQIRLIHNDKEENITNFTNDANISFLTFLDDGTSFLSGDASGKIKFWNMANNSGPYQIVDAVPGDNDDVVMQVAFAKDEQLMLCALAESREIKLWKKESTDSQYEFFREINTGLRGVRSVNFNPDETAVVVAGIGGIKVYAVNIEEESPIQPVATFTINESPDYAHYSDDGTLIFSYNFDGPLRVWDATGGTLKMNFPDMINTNWGTLFGDSKKWMVVVTERGNNLSRATWFDSDELIRSANKNPWMGALTPDEIESYQIEPYLQLAGYLDANGTPAPIIEQGNEEVIYQFGRYFSERCRQSEQVAVKQDYYLKSKALFLAGKDLAVLHKPETYDWLLEQLERHSR